METVHPLRAFRLRKGWSLDLLAEMTRQSKSKLSRIENRHQDADLEFIRKMNELSDGALTANDFMENGPDRPDATHQNMAGASE